MIRRHDKATMYESGRPYVPLGRDELAVCMRMAHVQYTVAVDAFAAGNCERADRLIDLGDAWMADYFAEVERHHAANRPTFVASPWWLR